MEHAPLARTSRTGAGSTAKDTRKTMNKYSFVMGLTFYGHFEVVTGY